MSIATLGRCARISILGLTVLLSGLALGGEDAPLSPAKIVHLKTGQLLVAGQLRWEVDWVVVTLEGGHEVGFPAAQVVSVEDAPEGAMEMKETFRRVAGRDPGDEEDPTFPPPDVEGSDPSERISPGLARRLETADPGEPIRLIVSTRRSPGEEDLWAVEKSGGSVRQVFERTPGFSAELPASAVIALAAESSVLHVSEDLPMSPDMDVARVTVGAEAVFRDPALGLDGAGIGVAVIDSGIYEAKDLKDKDKWNKEKKKRLKDQGVKTRKPIAERWEAYKGSGKKDDDHGHGTLVAAVLGGSGSESSDDESYRSFTGIAPGAHLVSVKVFDKHGSSFVSDVIHGVDWLLANAEELNVRVVNLSMSHPIHESYRTDPLCQALTRAWEEGIVVVVSAGNRGRDGYATVNSPGNCPVVITVGASNDFDTPDPEDDLVTTFSSRGPSLGDGILKPDLVAPGNRIISAKAKDSRLDEHYPQNRVARGKFRADKDGHKDSGYFEVSGTSFAAPIVAGAAALMLEAEPSLTPDSVKARLMESARKTPENVVTAGAGHLDIPAAIRSAAVSADARSPRLVVGDDGTVVVESLGDIGAPPVVEGDAGLWGDLGLWGDAGLWGDVGLWGDAGLWGDVGLWGDAGLWGDIQADSEQIEMNGD